MNFKRTMVHLAMVAGVVLMLMPVNVTAAAETGSMSVARLEICNGVENREPVGVADTFAADITMVYAFLEMRDIPEETTVSFVWFHGDDEVARVPVRIGRSGRWRTYSSKKLGGRIGAWRVEIQDENNTVLGAADFTVK